MSTQIVVSFGIPRDFNLTLYSNIVHIVALAHEGGLQLWLSTLHGKWAAAASDFQGSHVERG